MTDQRGLRSQTQEVVRMEREIMDLKMEVAHLRERLMQRAGGDMTTAELEAEVFALESSLGEAHKIARAREVEKQTLMIKCENTKSELLQTSEAFQQSRQQTRQAQDAQMQAERRLEDAANQCDALQHQLQDANDRESTLEERLDTLMQEKEQTQQERDEFAQQAKQRELQVHELRAQLETTRQKFETNMKEQEGATREDVRELQERLQTAEENAAALRGEIRARQEEAAKVDAELRDVQAAETSAKQRLVKLTEEHAALRVHLALAKEIAVKSTAEAIQEKDENDSMRRELDERDRVLKEKEQTIRALETEMVKKQDVIAEEIGRRKQTVQETEERLTTECQEMLQAQEETWSCREKVLQSEAESYKREIVCMQTFHVELMQLLETRENDVKVEQSGTIEPAKLRLLVDQEIRKRDALGTKLEQMKVKLEATKQQLNSQKQLEADNSKLRAEYEKAKLAMERMAIRKGKSFMSVTSPGRVSSHDNSSGNSSIRSADSPFKKRKMVEEIKTTPRKAQRSKRVYVASRYLNKS